MPVRKALCRGHVCTLVLHSVRASRWCSRHTHIHACAWRPQREGGSVPKPHMHVHLRVTRTMLVPGQASSTCAHADLMGHVHSSIYARSRACGRRVYLTCTGHLRQTRAARMVRAGPMCVPVVETRVSMGDRSPVPRGLQRREEEAQDRGELLVPGQRGGHRPGLQPLGAPSLLVAGPGLLLAERQPRVWLLGWPSLWCPALPCPAVCPGVRGSCPERTQRRSWAQEAGEAEEGGDVQSQPHEAWAPWVRGLLRASSPGGLGGVAHSQ